MNSRFDIRTIGQATSSKRIKCTYVRDQLGFDAAIDHSHPSSIDVYFENVGGPDLAGVSAAAQSFRARAGAICGLIAHCNGATGIEQNLPPATMLAALRRILLLRGYSNTEFVDDHYDSFLCEIGSRVRSGDIRYRWSRKGTGPSIGMLAGWNFAKHSAMPTSSSSVTA